MRFLIAILAILWISYYIKKEDRIMQKRLIALLEEIKLNRYYDYHDYLNNEDIEKITEWYNSFATTSSLDFDKIIGLMYELYLREDIDLRPYEDYIQLITYLADEYQFDKTNFLEIYKSFKDLLYK